MGFHIRQFSETPYKLKTLLCQDATCVFSPAKSINFSESHLNLPDGQGLLNH